MRELARGLLDSEYWELLSFVLINDMEDAKAMLEKPSTNDRDIRVNQGAAAALWNVGSFLTKLAKVEDEDGKESD